MSFRRFPELIILIDLVDIEVTCLALLELAPTGLNQVRFQVNALPLIVSFAIWEDAVFDLDTRAVPTIVDMAFTQGIRHIAHETVYHDAVELILDHSLHFYGQERLIAGAAVRARHIGPHVSSAHHIITAVCRTANWVIEDLEA